MPDSGKYPAEEWKSGNHYRAFDWSGHDQDDLPAEVQRQMHAESAHGTAGPDTVKRARTDAAAAKSEPVKHAAGSTKFKDLLTQRRKAGTKSKQ